MILAAEYIPSPLRLMLGRHSGIGNRIPRVPFFFPGNGEGIPRFPIWPGNREPPFPDSAGTAGDSGSRFGGPGDFMVCIEWRGTALAARARKPSALTDRGSVTVTFAGGHGSDSSRSI